MKKLLSLLAAAIALPVVLVGCGSDNNSTGGPYIPDDPDVVHEFPERYIVHTAWLDVADSTTIEVPEPVVSLARSLMGDDSSGTTRHLKVVYADHDVLGNNYYTILLGHIDNVPIVSGTPVAYSGTTRPTISRVTGTVSTATITQSVRRAVSETVFRSTTDERTYKVGASVTLFGLVNLGGGATIKETITNAITEERSIEDTHETANAKTEIELDIVTVTIGEAGEPEGRYRWSLFATADVYLSVKMSLDNTEIEDHEFSICARPTSYHWDIDWDPNLSGELQFSRDNPVEFFPFPDAESFMALLPPEEEDEPGPILITRFVAVSSGGGIAFSDDGIDWRVNYRNNNAQWNDITYADGKFVTVGNNGVMAYSNDGIDWVISPILSSPSVNWSGITFGVVNGDKTWVAVGNSGYTSTSSGGEGAWIWSTPRQVPGNRQLNGVVYARDRFVAVGNNGRIMHSTHGLTWTEVTTTDNHNNGIAFGNNTFVAVAAGNRVRHSPDGISWTTISNIGSNVWNNVAYSGSTTATDRNFIAVGPVVSGAGRIATSSNGTTWTLRDVGTSTWNGAVFGSGLRRWVLVGSATGSIGRIAYTTRAGSVASWTEATVGDVGTDEWQAVAFGTWEEEQ